MQGGAHIRRALALTATAALLVATTGCTRQRQEDRVLFDGQSFRAKASVVDKKTSLADFRVQVRDVSRSFEGAIAAGEYEGTRYCIEKYGNSRIDWSVGPETDPARLPVVDDTLTFSGTCRRP